MADAAAAAAKANAASSPVDTTPDAAAQEKENERQALADAAAAAAKAAADAQERVRAAHEALEKECHAAADLAREAEVARDRANPSASPDGDADSSFHDSGAYEAAVVANLHAQAAGVQNIRTLVPIVLDPVSAHYDRRRDLLLLVLERYALSSHVLSDTTYLDVPAWRSMDAVVLSWLFGAVTTELMETVRNRGGTARTAWLGIEAQFLGNREFHALQLDAKFRVFTQGDLSIAKMKSMANLHRGIPCETTAYM